MNGFTLADIADIVRETKPLYYKENKYTDLASRYQQYFAVPMFKRKSEEQYGSQIEIRTLTNFDSNTAPSKLFETVEITVNPILGTGTTRWGSMRTSWGIERRESALQGNRQSIVNYMQARRSSAEGDQVQTWENNWWTYRSTDDGVTPWNIWYYLVKNVSATDPYGGASTGIPAGGYGGFNGGSNNLGVNPLGIDNANYKNFTNKYTSYAWSDLGLAIMAAESKTGFRNPVPMQTSTPERPQWEIFCNLKTKLGIVTIARGQNDNLGYEITSGGQATVMGSTVNYVPALDADTDNPLILMDWGSWGIVTLGGEFMREETFPGSQQQPTVVTTHIHSMFNPICYDRRRNAVLSMAASYTG